MTSGQSLDPVRLAMEHALKINRFVDPGNKKLRSRLRSRARELPGLVLDSGLVPALLFFLSKAEKEGYSRAVGVLPCQGSPAGGVINDEDNKYAYGLIARAVVCALDRTGKLPKQDNDGNSINIDDITGIVESLGKMRGIGELEATLEIMEYLVSLKRAAEALWEKEE